jgi:hypothetical protein
LLLLAHGNFKYARACAVVKWTSQKRLRLVGIMTGMSSGGGLRSTRSVPIEGMIAGIEHGRLGDSRPRNVENALATRETHKRMTKEMLVIILCAVVAALILLWLLLTWNP